MNKDLFIERYFLTLKDMFPEGKEDEMLSLLKKRLWLEMGNDPVYFKLGEARFYQLSESEQLEILARWLDMKQAAYALQDALVKRKSKKL